MNEIFIVRICLLPLRNPLTLDNLQIFTTFQEAYDSIKQFMDTHKLYIKENSFNEKNRYYVYEDFMNEQFIWIEKHEIKM